jgi:hypothetical protein
LVQEAINLHHATGMISRAVGSLAVETVDQP